MENEDHGHLTRYTRFSLETDNVVDVLALEEWIRSALEKVPMPAWKNVRNVSESWSYNKHIRLTLVEEIFEALLNEELDRRKERGEEIPSFVIPEDEDDEDEYSPLKIRTWSEVAEIEFPKNPWRIHKILPLLCFEIIAATAAGRKTWIALEYALALTTPRPFLHDEFFVTQGCNVLYIDGEMAISEFQRRGKQLGLSDERKYQIYYLNIDSLNLYDETCGDLEKIVDAVRRYEIGVVIIDTLRAVAGGLKEEKAEEVRAFFNRLRVLKDLGVSVIILDHLRKKQPFEGKTPTMEQLFSSQDKAASADIINMLKPDNDSNTIMFYQVKNRLGIALKPFRILMTDSAEIESEDNRTKIAFDAWEQEEETLFEQAKVIVLEVLQNGPLKRKELLDVTKKLNAGSEKTIRRACKALVESGLITSTKDGREVSFSLLPPENGDVEGENEDKSLF